MHDQLAIVGIHRIGYYLFVKFEICINFVCLIIFKHNWFFKFYHGHYRAGSSSRHMRMYFCQCPCREIWYLNKDLKSIVNYVRVHIFVNGIFFPPIPSKVGKSNFWTAHSPKQTISKVTNYLDSLWSINKI